MEPYEPPQPRRETMLTIILTGMVGLFSFGLLILVTGGWFFWLVLVLGGLVFVCFFHYLTWGKLFSEEVAGEREEEILRQRAIDEWHEGERGM